MEVIPGEFGMTEACALEHGTLILPEFNRTGKGGLTLATKTLIANATKPVIVYMERGDGVTFCQKAITAQDAGASAVVIGNNVTEPWPYVMKDSKGEAVGDKVSIPIVMVKLADGQALVSFFRQRNNTTVECAKWNLRMEPQNQNCVICTESFSISEVLLRLPACGHHFHESCAMQWLTSHNTCPYCRRELPTDDAAYEQERRRTERTHASSDSAAGRSSQYQDFYG
jgi:Zn finger protein HypA/HybF involved in hydrogenase expression